MWVNPNTSDIFSLFSSCSIVTRSSKRKLNQNLCPETKTNAEPQSSSATRDLQTKTKDRKAKETKIDKSSPVPSVSPKFSSRKRSSLGHLGRLSFSDLTGDVLEHVARYLDTNSAVSLLRTCTTVYLKLSEVCWINHLRLKAGLHIQYPSEYRTVWVSSIQMVAVMWLSSPFDYRTFWTIIRLFQSNIWIPDRLTTGHKSTI